MFEPTLQALLAYAQALTQHESADTIETANALITARQAVITSLVQEGWSPPATLSDDQHRDARLAAMGMGVAATFEQDPTLRDAHAADGQVDTRQL